MQKTMLVLALSLVATSAFADSYRCTLAQGSYDDFGATIDAAISSRTIKLTGTSVGAIKGKIDKGYTPRAKNAGSIRFDADVNPGAGSGTGCDTALIMLNKAMANGGDGRLTIAYDCDSDGTGPIFYNYNCQQ